MIPLRDVIPTRTTPGVTIGLIALNAAVFAYELALPAEDLAMLVRGYGLVPAWFTWPALLTAMFFHTAWAAFLGNMLFLWLFGDGVEDRFGHARFLLLYLACGAAATAAQAAMHPFSRLPIAGSGGAVAGVMGAYLVLYPHSRILTLVPIIVFVDLLEIPAMYFFCVWVALQLSAGGGSIGPRGDITFWAQLAGFAAGALLTQLLQKPERQRLQWFYGEPT